MVGSQTVSLGRESRWFFWGRKSPASPRFIEQQKGGKTKKMREYSRVEISWPVILHTVQGLIDGELRNASVEGGLIHCHELIELTEPLDVTIEIPETGLPVSATVEVVRSETHDEDGSFPSCDLAFRFLEMSEEGRRIFCTAIERQAQTLEHTHVTREKVSIAMQVELIKTLEKLTIEFERPLNDLLEEAIEDLVIKYENQPMPIAAEPESDKRQNAALEG